VSAVTETRSTEIFEDVYMLMESIKCLLDALRRQGGGRREGSAVCAYYIYVHTYIRYWTPSPEKKSKTFFMAL
jgi:hypothetical protein